jgi:type II secretory pathway component GspD/PulD (secretin)
MRTTDYINTKETTMVLRRTIVSLGAFALLLVASTAAHPQASEPAAAEPEGGIPVQELITIVAQKTGKKFLVDPRVRARVTLIGQDLRTLDQSDLATVLSVHGFMAVENGGYVNVVPDANARQMPVPIVTGRESFPDSTVVTKVFVVKSVSSAHLVPILRPMIPQYGHLVAYPCRNTLLLVDTFANVKRIEKIIQAIDVGEPYAAPSCSPEPAPKAGS